MPELPEVETIRAALEPRLVGRTFVAAGAFPSAKFTAAPDAIGHEVVDEVYDDQAPAGEVLSQDPTSGTLYRGDVVRLVVSKGPDLVEVPDVHFYGIDAATEALTGAGFEVVAQDAEGSLVRARGGTADQEDDEGDGRDGEVPEHPSNVGIRQAPPRPSQVPSSSTSGSTWWVRGAGRAPRRCRRRQEARAT